MENRSNTVPMLAAIVLLLPLVYVGIYLALVTPAEVFDPPYRCGGRASEIVFAPLEYIDRRVRPDAWGDQLIRLITTTIVPSSGVMISADATDNEQETKQPE